MNEWIFFLFTFLVVQARFSDHFAVLIDSSIYFRNFRHVVNTLTIYKHLLTQGIPEENIIVMIADDMQCNARNYHYGKIYDDSTLCDLSNEVFIDYLGEDVSLSTFLNLLLDDLPSSVSSKRRLHSNENSTLLLFLNGHGGDGFFKFREREELNSHILWDVLYRMFRMKRYGEVMVLIDTCQASSLIPDNLPPYSSFLVSSSVGEESYSHGFDYHYGLPVKDRFVTSLMRSLKECDSHPVLDGVAILNKYFNYRIMQSTAVWRSSYHSPFCSFFGFSLVCNKHMLFTRILLGFTDILRRITMSIHIIHELSRQLKQKVLDNLFT